MKPHGVWVVTLALLSLGATEGRATPPGNRASLIISEVSPVAADNGHAWFELHNPTLGRVALSGMVFRTGAGSSYTIPDLSGLPEERQAITRDGYVQVVLDDGDDSTGLDRSSSGLLLHAPSALASAWTPSGGELVLYRTPPGTLPEDGPLDYVAWGRPGQPWSEKGRRSLWPRTGFVLLAESFGAYDPGTEIVPGASIGLYPGTSTAIVAEDWVLFDSDEVTPGLPNRVPRPKAFTLANGAEIGSRSFAVGWVKRKGDDWYRFELAADRDFGTPVATELTTMPVIRLGEDPRLRRVYYRVQAYSGGRQSLPTSVRYAVLSASVCDWPPPPSPFDPRMPNLALGDWLMNPACNPPSCRLMREIQFKFQRKDTPLRCCYYQMQNKEPAPGCPSAAPHPYCHKVTLQDRPSYILCAGRPLSPLCGSWPPAVLSRPPASISPDPVPIFEAVLEPYIRSERSCTHGEDNCVRASISMIASAYGGACLSQDYIARQLYTMYRCSTFPINDERDLGHSLTMDCSNGGGECSEMLRWALKIGPNWPIPQLWLLSHLPSAPGFSEIQGFVDQGRPIMTEAELPRDADGNGIPDGTSLHMRVLSGYCIDPQFPPGSPEREWVYIYDPKTGPQAVTYNTWKDTATNTWAAPSISAWSAVRHDPPTIWADAGDGSSMFDWIARFQNDPCVFQSVSCP